MASKTADGNCAVQIPSSLRIVKPLEKRSTLLGVGFEHALFACFYAIALYYCFQTAGVPRFRTLSRISELREQLLSVNQTSRPPVPLLGLEAEYTLEDLDRIPVPNDLLPDFWALLVLTVVFILHALLWFVQRWWIPALVAIKYRATPDGLLHLGHYAYIQPKEHQGAAAIVKMNKSTMANSVCCFTFQRQQYDVKACHSGAQVVEPLAFPVGLPLKEYAAMNGFSNHRQLEFARDRFGTNDLNLPCPSFRETFLNQILGPVPVFQMFCTCLWLLDEYWNYAIFSLFMIFMFEATTAFGRVKSVATLRGMKIQSRKLFAYRCNEWQSIDSEQLLPGDIFSLCTSQKGCSHSENDDTIPCDALILKGRAVVNESTLTGESTPTVKEAVELCGDDLLDMDSCHRMHVLFSGTSLLQVSVSPNCEEQNQEHSIVRCPPPDSGCVCYCLRTGFSSSQGKLLRMIENSSEQVRGDVKETLALFSILLTFALCSSAYVLYQGLIDGKRTQYELVLRCVLILTSVVPPELPMQAALAVNTALMSLWKAQVFCTEPFRIPYAGKVDTVLLDKTGTITSDQLMAVGVSSCDASGLNSSLQDSLIPMKDAGIDIKYVLAGCHSIVDIDGKLVGDPIETSALKAINWCYRSDLETAWQNTLEKGNKSRKDTLENPVTPPRTAARVKIFHRYHFLSALQRMSVIAEVGDGTSPKQLRVLTKGSPEAISKLCKSIPDEFKFMYQSLAENGMRVLALAGRELTDHERSEVQSAAANGKWPQREKMEQNMNFVGMVAFSCLLRRDSTKVVSELKVTEFVCSGSILTPHRNRACQ